MLKSVVIVGIAAIVAAAIVIGIWIHGVSGLSSIEARLIPIATFLSCTQDDDLVAVGVSVGRDGGETEVNGRQVTALVERIQRRSGLKSPFPVGADMKCYRFFFSRVTDAETLRRRAELAGCPRPYCVTVYEVGDDGVFDRSKDGFFTD